MRIISWNMAHRRRSWDYLRELDFDLLLLQEANFAAAPSWVRDQWPDQVMWPVASWGWGSAILAKPALKLAPYGGEASGMELDGWIATGVVVLPDDAKALVGSFTRHRCRSHKRISLS